MKKDFLNKIHKVILVCFASINASYAGGMGPVATVHNWTGFYIGGNAGALWGHYSVPVWIEPLLIDGSFVLPSTQYYNDNLSSFTGGGQVGYNYQTVTNWLIGAEFSFNGEHQEGLHYVTPAESVSSRFTAGDSYGVQNDWHAGFLARLGYAWNNWMWYGVGGVSLANANVATTFLEVVVPGTPTIIYPAASGNNNSVMVGGTVGLGLAYALSPNLSIGVEGRYTNYGSQKFDVTTVAVLPVAGSFGGFYYQPTYTRLTVSTGEILVKINYQFT